MKWGSWTSKKEQKLKGPGEHTCHLPCLWTEPDLSLDFAEPPGGGLRLETAMQGQAGVATGSKRVGGLVASETGGCN